MTNETKIYREDDVVLKVEVLENFSASDIEHYRLKVTDVIQDSAIYKPSHVGQIFDVGKLRNVCFGGMWELDEE